MPQLKPKKLKHQTENNTVVHQKLALTKKAKLALVLMNL
jgi:hypothetical protein